MSKALKVSLIGIGVVVASATLVTLGAYLARVQWFSPWGWRGFGATGYDSESLAAVPHPYGGRMGLTSPEGNRRAPFAYSDPGRMGTAGMMGGYGMMNGTGMMGGYGMMGGMGVMGGFSSSGLLGIDPLTVAQAEAAVHEYVQAIEVEGLELGEVMIFDNHAYAQLIEADTGMGALEVLVDPVTLAVSPEPGPNMIWNLKYSPMSGFGRLGRMGMMWNQSSESMDEMMGDISTEDLSSEMPLPPEDALLVADRYLEAYLPGTQADVHTDPFYGYYTIHVLREGNTVGMLSVNGYTRQVFLHTWHGELLDMTAGEGH